MSPNIFGTNLCVRVCDYDAVVLAELLVDNDVMTTVIIYRSGVYSGG